MRTVKLAAATPSVHAHLREVDGGRVDAAVREHRVQALLDGVPIVMVQCGVVAAWAVLVAGGWGLATALLVAGAVNGFDWFGRVAGSVITEAPGTRAWMRATSRLAGGGDLMHLPAGRRPGRTARRRAPAAAPRDPLRDARARRAHGGPRRRHDRRQRRRPRPSARRAGAPARPGRVGQVQPARRRWPAWSSSTGEIRWNGQPSRTRRPFLRPGRVAHVAQVPRVLSGTFADNVAPRPPRPRRRPGARDRPDGAATSSDAGGADALVGHRGVRLSGGQVQRLALARGLACDAELLLADDVSSALDAATEIELWAALRERGATVIGATSKRAALAQADRVVVLVEGRVAAVGPWTELRRRWGHLAGLSPVPDRRDPPLPRAPAEHDGPRRGASRGSGSRVPAAPATARGQPVGHDEHQPVAPSDARTSRGQQLHAQSPAPAGRGAARPAASPRPGDRRRTPARRGAAARRRSPRAQAAARRASHARSTARGSRAATGRDRPRRRVRLRSQPQQRPRSPVPTAAEHQQREEAIGAAAGRAPCSSPRSGRRVRPARHPRPGVGSGRE